MTDIRQDLTKATGALRGFAKEASYVAIGVGVLGFQKAQARRQELADAAARARQGGCPPGSLAGRREQVRKCAKDFDATVAQVVHVIDSTLEPVVRRLPQPVQAVVQQAREARDQLRAQVFGTAA